MPTQVILSSGTTAAEIAGAIKLLVAVRLAKKTYAVSYDVSVVPRGLAPALMSEDHRVLIAVNAAVRYLLFSENKGDETQISHWLEWESRQALTSQQDLTPMETYLQTHAEFPHPIVDCVLFGWIAGWTADFSFLSAQFPKSMKWFENKKAVESYREGLAELHHLSSTASSRKVKEGVARSAKPLPAEHVPQKEKRNILITSALPYVNNVPHLGNIIGCVLSADVFARYCRLRGYNTLYICGTDEYGTATETKALADGVSCQELCNKYHQIHHDVYKWFDIDFDYFGRTTTPLHTQIAQEIFMKLKEKNLLLTDAMKQLFCEKCQRYLADRYVEGVCPLCQYPDARGDQCDGCGKLLNPFDLKEPRCKLDGHTPVVRESQHMFLDLPSLQKRCEQFVEKSSQDGCWSTNGYSITQSWLREGLIPRCITRDLNWGTPVPLKEMEGKVLYVWFDAPIGYLSITANYTKQWEKWWKNPDQVKLYQFMGKDNVPFHSVIFPCSLLGTDEPYTMLHHLSTTEYLNYENEKFSKSRNVGVFGTNVQESGIPVSVWRYYLISNRPESNDSNFMWTELAMKTNSELLNNLGNFVNRSLKFLKAKYNSVVPAYAVDPDSDGPFVEEVNTFIQHYIQSLEAVKIRAGLKAAMDVSMRANLYLQDNKLDDSLFEKSRKRCDTVLGLAVNTVYLLSAMIEPYMPSTSESLCEQLNVPPRTLPPCLSLDILPGHRLGNPSHLFRRLDEKDISALQRKYGGGSSPSKAEPKKSNRKSKTASEEKSKK